MYHIKSHCFYCGIRNANFDNFCLGVGVSVYVLAQVCFICVFVWGSELEHSLFMLLTELCSQALFDL